MLDGRGRSAALAVLAVTAAVSFSVAGCGGGSGGTPSAAGVTVSMPDSVSASSDASSADTGATPPLAADTATTTSAAPSASPSKAAATTTSHAAVKPTTKPSAPVNTCAHPLTPAQAAKCPAPHPTDAAPHPRLVGAAGVSCTHSGAAYRGVARFTFDAIGSDWNVSFSDSGAHTSVSGNSVTVTDDVSVSGTSGVLSGSVYFITPGGDTSVPVSVTVTCK